MEQHRGHVLAQHAEHSHIVTSPRLPGPAMPSMTRSALAPVAILLLVAALALAKTDAPIYVGLPSRSGRSASCANEASSPLRRTRTLQPAPSDAS